MLTNPLVKTLSETFKAPPLSERGVIEGVSSVGLVKSKTASLLI